jgi:acyl carrier protein phosphodiesterase
MNFLAHAYLSFGQPELITGNMISDFVKGKRRYDYPNEIQRGIELHRRIDTFTDAHIATNAAKDIFRKDYRLYSGPIVDVVFDHFLANDDDIFSESSLKIFTENIYEVLEKNSQFLPLRFISVLSYMKADNWLYNYRNKEGVRKSLKGLIRRSAFLSESESAFTSFNERYSELGNCYKSFFGDVKLFAHQQLDLIS